MTVEKKFVEKKISRGVGEGGDSRINFILDFKGGPGSLVMVKSGMCNRVLNWTITITITTIVKCI